MNRRRVGDEVSRRSRQGGPLTTARPAPRRIQTGKFSRIASGFLAALFLTLLSPLVVTAQTNFIPRLVIGQKVYTDVEVMRVTEQFAVIRFAGGMAQVAFSNCAPEIQGQLRAAMGLPELSITNSAEPDGPRLGFGKFQAANVVSIDGSMAGWTNCQLQISNKIDKALLLRLPESIAQYFQTRNMRSNDIVELNGKIQETAEKLRRMRAYAPQSQSARSMEALMKVFIPMMESELAKQRAMLQGLQDSYRQLLLHEPESTRVWVRRTGQVYESVTVWECPKPAPVPTS